MSILQNETKLREIILQAMREKAPKAYREMLGKPAMEAMIRDRIAMAQEMDEQAMHEAIEASGRQENGPMEAVAEATRIRNDGIRAALDAIVEFSPEDENER